MVETTAHGRGSGNHFACIGFDLDIERAVAKAIPETIARGTHFETPRGHLVAWSLAICAEVWCQINTVNGRNVLMDCHPHFVGSARMSIGITRMTTYPERPSDGTLSGWADPEKEDDPESGCYPFHFHVPDFDLHRDHFTIPSTTVFQIAAFPSYLRCYDTEEQYLASARSMGSFPDGNPVVLGPQAFIPLDNETNEKESPSEYALFTGKVKTALNLIPNAVGGRSFWHLMVETYDGNIDVVVHPEIMEGSPRVGGIIEGSFWLSGRLVDGGTSKPSPEIRR